MTRYVESDMEWRVSEKLTIRSGLPRDAILVLCVEGKEWMKRIKAIQQNHSALLKTQ